jgi:hypothetical protein
MERQAAAAKRAQVDQEGADEAAEKRQKLCAEVDRKWTAQRAHIEQFINRLNQELSENGVQLYVRGPRTASSDPPIQVDQMDIDFDQYPQTQHMRKLSISVRPNGEIYVHIATKDISPVKQYTLNAFEATNEQLEGTVLDFLDANTPV